MPIDSEIRSPARQSGYLLDGVYTWLLERERRDYDPRPLLGLSEAEADRLEPLLPRLRPERVAALEAGEPVEVPVGLFGRNFYPEVRRWDVPRSVTRWRVFADDTLVPVTG